MSVSKFPEAESHWTTWGAEGVYFSSMESTFQTPQIGALLGKSDVFLLAMLMATENFHLFQHLSSTVCNTDLIITGELSHVKHVKLRVLSVRHWFGPCESSTRCISGNGKRLSV